ncbi:hypothetical protein GCK32_008404 [Trichostrongylus colubriformis]|uniref:Uncharacterized protein n=1 Tax=Trichostrongylus colubriformis TaxID=6319 RepID=A0AAN8IQ76_TRICO
MVPWFQAEFEMYCNRIIRIHHYVTSLSSQKNPLFRGYSTPSGQSVGRTGRDQPRTPPSTNRTKEPQPSLVRGLYPQGGSIVGQGEASKVC